MMMQQGGEKLKEAFYIYRDLTDKSGPSPLLLKGVAVFQMKTNKFEEAFESLQEALKVVRPLFFLLFPCLVRFDCGTKPLIVVCLSCSLPAIPTSSQT